MQMIPLRTAPDKARPVEEEENGETVLRVDRVAPMDKAGLEVRVALVDKAGLEVRVAPADSGVEAEVLIRAV